MEESKPVLESLEQIAREIFNPVHGIQIKTDYRLDMAAVEVFGRMEGRNYLIKYKYSLQLLRNISAPAAEFIKKDMRKAIAHAFPVIDPELEDLLDALQIKAGLRAEDGK